MHEYSEQNFNLTICEINEYIPKNKTDRKQLRAGIKIWQKMRLSNLHHSFTIIPEEANIAIVTNFFGEVPIIKWGSFGFFGKMLRGFNENMIAIPIETSDDKT